ncbi:putative ABC transporter periplasmic binding protein/polyhydroxybutyrate synthase [Paraburkholderia tropica]|uniref:ABC transporter substrate-binding protein n=1 Tax=Paraburkholderia TaxID=1822464 RepID=UPI001CB4F0B4|nr:MULTISPECIES: ABC transporter substrate-binding protein [Paraburkholderia]CAG9220589.1 putative ABC transporter periplasmic binding protein/polyhydroxybutyrate synthase [Paraburkholderia tropica]
MSHTTRMAAAIALAALVNTGLASAAGPLTQLGKPEGQVNIIAWPGYIERGDTDKKYDWVTGFEKESGCKVNVKTAATSDEMVTLMNQGGYDLVTASGDASLRLVYGKKVQPINTALIPAWNTVEPRLQNAPWHTVNGVHYGVPYQWGANFLAYNTKIFPKAPTSWSVVFEQQTLPDGKSNKGRVQAYNGAIYVADAAVYLMHKNPALGIKDPYELNEAQYAEVLKVLRAQKPLVHRYWHDVTVQMNDFKNEGVAVSSAWGYAVNSLQAEKFPIAATIPQEGATGWADTTMMHADAPHPVCAYKWMNWSLNRKLQADLAEWFGSNPVIQGGCQQAAVGGSNFCVANGYDRFDQIHFWKTPVANCSQGKCVPYSRWTQDFISIMGGR